MPDHKSLLRHYRLNLVEGWIGYAVATAAVLLWPEIQATPWPVVWATYLGLLGAVSLVSLMVIERRRPWPFGPPYETSKARMTRAWFAWYFASIVAFQVGTGFIRTSALGTQISLVIGYWLLSWTVIVVWAPLRTRIYPRLGPAHAPASSDADDGRWAA